MLKSDLNLLKSIYINRSSDGKTLYMKVAQNDESNPNTQPVRPPRIPTITNTQLSPPIHLPENAKHRGYFPGCFPPSPVSPPTALGHS